MSQSPLRSPYADPLTPRAILGVLGHPTAESDRTQALRQVIELLVRGHGWLAGGYWETSAGIQALRCIAHDCAAGPTGLFDRYLEPGECLVGAAAESGDLVVLPSLARARGFVRLDEARLRPERRAEP